MRAREPMRVREINNLVLAVLVGLIVCIPVMFFGALIAAQWLTPQGGFVSGFLAGLLITLSFAALYVFIRQKL